MMVIGKNNECIVGKYVLEIKENSVVVRRDKTSIELPPFILEVPIVLLEQKLDKIFEVL